MSTGDPARPLWVSVLAVGLSLLVLLLAASALVQAIRDLRSERNQLLRRDPRTTGAVTRALRRGQDVTQEDRLIAQAVVDGTRGTARLVVLMVAVSASSAFQAVAIRGSVPWLSSSASAICLLAAVVGALATRSLRRGGARIGLRPGGGGA